jgi:putative ABC transport system permease protein
VIARLRLMFARLRAALGGRRSDDALDADIQAHLDLLVEDYMRGGLSPEEARIAARRAFGGVQQMKESYREQRGLPLVEDLLQDLRHSGRSLRRSPGLTVVAIVTIALGIFGPTVTFTMAKAWILEPLPFARPNELLDLRTLDKQSGNFGAVNAADFLDWRRSTESFEEIAGYTQSNVRLTGGDQAEHVRGAMVTPNFFKTLGVETPIGRVFDPGAQDAGRSKEVVISHLMWRERFHSDPAVLGRVVQLNAEDFTIVGVLPETFQFTLLGRCDVWRPLVFTPEQAAERRGRMLIGLGRLRQRRSVEDARQELTQVVARLASTYPETNARRGVRVLRLADEVRVHHDLGFIVPVMFAMVGCVLLIACVNVTNVMLARTSTRRQEMAVRLALGASRARIVRQWLVEHVLLFVAASLAGAALAVYGADWITQSIPVENRQYLRNYAVLPVDRIVLLFALLIGGLCGLVFGAVTATTGVRADAADLRDASTRATAGRSGTRLRASLVVCEVALSLAVLISAGLLVATARNIARVDVGFDPHRLLTFQLALDAQRYRTPADIQSFYERLTDDLAKRPAATSAAAGSLVPFGTEGSSAEFFPEGAPETTPAETPSVALSRITADYVGTLRLRLMRGRALTAADGAEAPRAALINETLASRHFPGQDPIGRRFRLARGNPDLWTVVGVVADVKNFETIDTATPQAYVPFAQQPRRAMTVVVRTAGEPDALSATVRGAVAAIDPREPIVDMASMEARIHRVTGPYQTIGSFVMFFGAVTLLLAGIGVYGVISYSWAQRTREIGIRMALGARRADVGRLVIVQIRTFLLAALVPGLALAWGIGRALQAMLFGVTATDWRLYLSMTGLLAAVALVAVLVPARRAMSIDPMAALRDE